MRPVRDTPQQRLAYQRKCFPLNDEARQSRLEYLKEKEKKEKKQEKNECNLAQNGDILLRVSLLNQWQQCPRKAVKSFFNPPPSTEAQELGTRTHAQLLKDSATAAAYLKKLGIVPDGNVVAEERYQRIIPNAGITLTGGIDIHDAHNVYDLKTTSKKASKKIADKYLDQPQTVVYAWLLAGQKQSLAIRDRWIISQSVKDGGQRVALGTVVVSKRPYRTDMAFFALADALEFARAIRGHIRPEVKPNPFCKYCPFFNASEGCRTGDWSFESEN